MDITDTYKHKEGELTYWCIQSETAPPNRWRHFASAGSKKERDVFLYASTRDFSKAEEEEGDEEEEEEEVEDNDNAGMEETANNISTAEKFSLGFQEVRPKLSRTPG